MSVNFMQKDSKLIKGIDRIIAAKFASAPLSIKQKIKDRTFALLEKRSKDKNENLTLHIFDKEVSSRSVRFLSREPFFI